MKKFLLAIFLLGTFHFSTFGQDACADCEGACINVSLAPIFGVSDVSFSIIDSFDMEVYAGVSPLETGELCLIPGCYTLGFIDENGDLPNLLTVHIEDGEGNVLVDLIWDFNLGLLSEIPFCIPEECADADFNCDMVVNSNDLLSFLVYYGCAEDCNEGDLNGDGVVNAGDLLAFLGIV